MSPQITQHDKNCPRRMIPEFPSEQVKDAAANKISEVFTKHSQGKDLEN